MLTLRLVGPTGFAVFGVAAGERLKRQIERLDLLRCGAAKGVFIARADTVTLETTLEWLSRNPRRFLCNEGGEPVICFVDGEERSATVEAAARVLAGAPLGDEFKQEDAASLTVFSRTLRTRQKLVVFSLAATSGLEAERTLFRHVYKGVTDVVTRYVWPLPAFWTTRTFAYAGIAPNLVTIVGIILSFVAAAEFATSHWEPGLAAAWLVTFLDTVDGKLARVTATSSRLGDKLDHVSDWVHPPLWWACAAIGAARTIGDDFSLALTVSTTAILASYVGGRASEKLFKKRFGFNQYLWRPYDGYLRSVIARRNTILLVLTAGALCSQMILSMHVVAVWCVVSIGLQMSRWMYAEWRARSGHRVESWMQADA
ncbi:MAG: CDP-alcohol phosphatidyltransferase family protein [Panacagrimonas sp.]